MSKSKVLKIVLVFGALTFFLLPIYFNIISCVCGTTSGYGDFSKNANVKIIIPAIEVPKIRSVRDKRFFHQNRILFEVPPPDGKYVDSCGKRIKSAWFTGFVTETKRDDSSEIISVFDVKEGKVHTRRIVKEPQVLVNYSYPEDGGEIREYLDREGKNLYTEFFNVTDKKGLKFSAITCGDKDCTELKEREYLKYYR